MMSTKESCLLLDLGLLDLTEADRLMERLIKLRLDNVIPDLLLLMSHYPCLSIGVRKLNKDDLLKPLRSFEEEGIPLIKTMRGGGLTYHWQGQLACYPIFKLLPPEQNLSDYMFRLEEIGLRTLKDLEVAAYRRRENVSQIGLWWKNNKIASMGIHVAKWVTSFGFSLNLSGDAGPSRYIRPCGLDDVHLTTVTAITGKEPQRKQVISLLAKHFQNIFLRPINVAHIEIEGAILNFQNECLSSKNN